ncbi:alpha-galactosidase [Halalkalibacterium halodurans]|uniref:alpha-galactosidase n=1 Tax=Halalkalibacterium halodurans TaxID=86665 RepID=UPI002AA99E55|nr:alpha-galactosidase [Halalkalibacterium halodurans]MDY7222667.1 alpha-galactosidase [Halalkalibacterium halodurans]MDY7241888.1 alpha-galactosidase [Halalkalibacterium halodurans]
MAILLNEEEHFFHLQSTNMSYIIQIENGFPLHAYWGPKLHHNKNLTDLIFCPMGSTIDRLPQEYPQYGSGDFRHPAYQVQLEDGSRVTELVYKSYRMIQGKPSLTGLPAVYVESKMEASTLEIELEDKYTGLTVVLIYTIFEERNVLTRSTKFIHKGSRSIKLRRALSACVDFHRADLEILYLSGAWTREGHLKRRQLEPGSTIIESRRGMSSHQLNPFVAILDQGTTEDTGDAYGFSLVYSGNFVAEAEVDSFQTTRVTIGVNPFDFSWQLEPGEQFQTPEVVMVYSAHGIGGMSRTFHKLYRTRLCRGPHRDKERPILVNNWEATYFDFDADKIQAIAKVAAELGIELFVLDDGWYGTRNDDTSSLGDWVENRKKLPNGLADLANKVKHYGIQFGLWVEPEMVSPDSDLYRKHPDWCIHVKGRRRTEFRTQLVLDLSRKEVRDYLFESLSHIFSTVPISYIKWDMNRALTELGSADLPVERQSETAHRYVLGLYELLERIVTSFPEILFESCSSGGGRFDPGMLYYMPQTWTSDNTDAIERLKIQYGTSVVYPVSSIGAHVSTSPNHQVGRCTPLGTRGDVAMSGNFGYELDLTKFTDAEKEVVKMQVATYKKIRSLVQQGELYRLKSPFEGIETAWMFVSEDQKEALVFYFQVLAEPHGPIKRLKLKGLNRDLDYKIKGQDTIFGGDRLLQIGLPIPELNGDFKSHSFHLTAI